MCLVHPQIASSQFFVSFSSRPLDPTLIVPCNVLFSALSWLFIFLVIPKNYFIIFFVALLLFRKVFGASRKNCEGDGNMYMEGCSTCIKDISCDKKTKTSFLTLFFVYRRMKSKGERKKGLIESWQSFPIKSR